MIHGGLIPWFQFLVVACSSLVVEPRTEKRQVKNDDT